MIDIEQNALEKLKDILAEENNPNLKLRVFVTGGGCSGFQYGFEMTEEKNDDDLELNTSGVTILVDSISMAYVQGAKISYKEDQFGSEFTIDNPNAVTTCGCGSSFSV